MLKIGCHLSSAGGFKAMGETALAIKANTFQFFTRNPRGGAAKAIDRDDAQQLVDLLREHGFARILAHAPYTLNACSADAKVRDFARRTFADDLQRMEYLPGNMYNFHPGSHVKQGVEIGIKYIAEMLNDTLWPEQNTIVLLETMAGKGSEIGRNFAEISSVLEKVNLTDKMGVCLDTCHLYDAGYDLVNDLDGVLEEFDKIIGLEKLQAVHLNDSKNPFASRKDRHEKIGQGSLGLKALTQVINHPVLRDLPFYLETPNELDGYAEEIRLLRSAYREVE